MSCRFLRFSTVTLQLCEIFVSHCTKSTIEVSRISPRFCTAANLVCITNRFLTILFFYHFYHNSSMEVLTSSSTYFSISEPKAKLMTRFSREMTLINSDSSDLTKKKVRVLFVFLFVSLCYSNGCPISIITHGNSSVCPRAKLK